MYPGTFDSHRKSEHISNSFCHLFWCEVRRCRVLLTSRLLMTGCGTREGAWEMCVCAQSCPTICDPIDSSLPDSTVCGIFQARILEWDAISYSGGSSQSRDWTCISCVSFIGKQIHYHWCHLGSPKILVLYVEGQIILNYYPSLIFYLFSCQICYVCKGSITIITKYLWSFHWKKFPHFSLRVAKVIIFFMLA